MSGPLSRVWWLPAIDGRITPIITYYCEVYGLDWNALDWMIRPGIRAALTDTEERYQL